MPKSTYTVEPLFSRRRSGVIIRFVFNSPAELCRARQRLVLLKQCQRELQIQFCQSHASLADTSSQEAELVAVSEEIVALETALVDAAMTNIA